MSYSIESRHYSLAETIVAMLSALAVWAIEGWRGVSIFGTIWRHIDIRGPSASFSHRNRQSLFTDHISPAIFAFSCPLATSRENSTFQPSPRVPPLKNLKKCRFLDAGGTRWRACSSPLWWSVSISGLCVIIYGVEIIHVGASGTGRTTFVNTLCESDVLKHKEPDAPEEAHLETGIRIKPANVGWCYFHHVKSVSLNLFQNSRRMASGLP